MALGILRFRRREDRLLLGLVFALAVFAATMLLVYGMYQHLAAEPQATADPLPVTAPRVCAAVAVYSQATADDWLQRAVIARTWLNRAEARGAGNCRPGLNKVLSENFSPILWQASLDAVDAVSSGDYAIPFACARVNTVIPLTVSRVGSPLFRTGARAQCVIRDLAFVELQR